MIILTVIINHLNLQAMRQFLTLIAVQLTLFAQTQVNVGVGTVTPSAPLHIKSASAVEMLRIEGTNPYISFFNNGQGYRGYLWSMPTEWN